MRARFAALLLALAGLASEAALAGPAADFSGQATSSDAHYVAAWVVDAGDHAGLPFAVVDKVNFRVHVFDAAGKLLGSAPVLLGSASGDDTVPGIGDRKLSAILPGERTTPAGRFLAAVDKSLTGDEILWVDYDSGLAMHRVITTVPAEHRLQRMASSLPAQHRITYGCINVPIAFFEQVVAPTFRGAGGIVYVLPEARPVRDEFGSYDVPPAFPQHDPQ